MVRAATASGLRVAPQATGHAAGALADTDLSDVVLLSLGGLRGATVDPVSRTARVLGGSQWNDVLAVAAAHGLTAMHGSSGDVSVVGYLLSGGLSFYGRTHGLAVDSVRAVQLVTADGAIVRASADETPDLFWALRGGSGAFGVVVSIEIDLLPYPDVFAGMLLWDASHAGVVAHAWAEWTATAPEAATTTLRVLHFPPMPELPPFLSGRSLVVVDGAILDTDAAASALLAPLRALEPEMDTFARIPSAGLVAVHMDPPDPTPALTAHVVLESLPGEAVEAFVAAAAQPGLFIVELRHLGGAVNRAPGCEWGSGVISRGRIPVAHDRGGTGSGGVRDGDGRRARRRRAVRAVADRRAGTHVHRWRGRGCDSGVRCSGHAAARVEAAIRPGGRVRVGTTRVTGVAGASRR